MKKKNLAVLGLTVLAGLSLASCGGQTGASSGASGTNGTNGTNGTGTTSKVTEEESVVDTLGGSGSNVSLPNYVSDGVNDTKGLDICLNYQGAQGITLRDNNYFNNVENTNYSKGNLLPTWKAFKENLNITGGIRDASDYSSKNDDDTYTKVSANGYKSQTENGRMIDLFYNKTANIEKMGAAGDAVDLLQYVNSGKMPAFKAWLEANPTMAKAITKGGKIYYTPYFDGYQDVERMFVMDTNVAKAVLDVASFDNFDTTSNGKGAASNTLQSATYKPYMDKEYNYRATKTTVPCLNGTKVEKVTITQTKNIILQQNELLEKGCTGKELAQQFRSYLDTAFAGYIGEGKIFENYSDIFVSESAAYNADELIALMRVVKANPGVITGDPNAEVEGLFPRGSGSKAHNRVDNIADFMQIWGIQGITSKKEMLFFDANGCINDAASTYQTYDGLSNLSALYQEGLIVDEFWNVNVSSSGTYYLDKYFGKTADNPGYGLLMYDYAASTGATNDIVDGIGTKTEKRQEGFKNEGAVTGVRAILPPLAYWATSSDFNAYEQELNDKTGKTLLRYSEENRSLKTTSWCIPSSSDNIDGAIRLMDYLFTLEGTRIQDFGPSGSGYWTLGTVAGTEAPVMSDTVKSMIGDSGTDFWSFMRAKLGSTHGIGYVRETAIQIQSCNYYAQIGLNNLEDAIAYGVVYANRVDKHGSKYSWDCTVPTAGYNAPSDQVSKSYADLTAFWASDKCAASAYGWVAVVKDGLDSSSTQTIGTNKDTNSYSYNSAFNQIDARLVNYLYAYANSLGSKFVPSYVTDLLK